MTLILDCMHTRASSKWRVKYNIFPIPIYEFNIYFSKRVGGGYCREALVRRNTVHVFWELEIYLCVCVNEICTILQGSKDFRLNKYFLFVGKQNDILSNKFPFHRETMLDNETPFIGFMK